MVQDLIGIEDRDKVFTANLVALRLIRSEDTYPVNVTPPAIEHTAKAGPWSLDVRFGPVDIETAKLVGLYDVGRNAVLDYMFGIGSGSADAGISHLAERDAKTDRLVAEYSLPEDWRDPAHLYTTIRASRRINYPNKQARRTETKTLLAVGSYFENSNRAVRSGGRGCNRVRYRTYDAWSTVSTHRAEISRMPSVFCHRRRVGAEPDYYAAV
jgi:hypothetical protein